VHYVDTGMVIKHENVESTKESLNGSLLREDVMDSIGPQWIETDPLC